MSLSSQDKLLSQLTEGASDVNHNKVFDESPHGNPREFYHIGRKFLGCPVEIEKQGGEDAQAWEASQEERQARECGQLSSQRQLRLKQGIVKKLEQIQQQ